MKTPPKHVRLFADPRRVRVSIRKRGGRWTCTIASREHPVAVSVTRKKPTDAVREAKLAAEAQGIEGVNLDLEWAYEHPQYRALVP